MRTLRRAGVAMLLWQACGFAQGPQPPCGAAAIPAYPALGEAAAVKLWSRAELGATWKPPACTGWSGEGFTTLVSTVARFRSSGGAEGLMRHAGAVSELAGLRYWSTTHKQWEVLIREAHAVRGTKSEERREEFTPEEMKAGAELYFEQTDNLSGKALYKLRILEKSAERIVFNVENMTTMKYFLVPVLHPGEMQSVYFLDRESDDVWRAYGLMRTGKNANGLIAHNEASTVNRAVAFFRRLVGIPPDQEPPAAR